MATWTWTNVDLGNGLLPDDFKPLLEPNFTLKSRVFCGTHLSTISLEVLMNQIRNLCLEITLSKLLHLPGTNELKVDIVKKETC